MRASVFMAEGSFAPRFSPPVVIKGLRRDGRSKIVSVLPPCGEGGEAISAEPGGGPACDVSAISTGLASLALARHPPCKAEGRFPVADAGAPARNTPLLPLAVPRLDGLLAGGLRRDALHEIRSSLSRDSGAATGFAAAILARLAAVDSKPILWIVEAASADEAGVLYGRGLERLGVDPKRLIVVRVTRPIEALWVAEEGLACRGLAAVLAEIKGAPRLLDLTATRRLALRARSGVMGLLLRQTDETEPSAATTRWRVEPLPATALDHYAAGIGHPAWRLILERNRRGTTGAIDVEWDHAQRSFAAIAAAGVAAASPTRTAHSVVVTAVPVDRPPAPADAGTVVALPVPTPREESRREIQRRIARAR
jgi:protein ImuA